MYGTETSWRLKAANPQASVSVASYPVEVCRAFAKSDKVIVLMEDSAKKQLLPYRQLLHNLSCFWPCITRYLSWACQHEEYQFDQVWQAAVGGDMQIKDGLSLVYYNQTTSWRYAAGQKHQSPWTDWNSRHLFITALSQKGHYHNFQNLESYSDLIVWNYH